MVFDIKHLKCVGHGLEVIELAVMIQVEACPRAGH